MEQKKNTGYKIAIILLVLLELFTVAKCNLEREEQVMLNMKIEKKDEEISQLKGSLQKYSESPKQILENARKAFYASDGDELAKYYIQMRRYHSSDPEIDRIIEMVKTLNGRINNEALRKVAQSISEEERRNQSRVVKMSPEEQAEILHILSLAQKESELKNKYGSEAVAIAEKGQVRIGWTKELCEAALGSPNEVAKTTNSTGVVEQWIYKNKILIFINGKLESITES